MALYGLPARSGPPERGIGWRSASRQERRDAIIDSGRRLQWQAALAELRSCTALGFRAESCGAGQLITFAAAAMLWQEALQIFEVVQANDPAPGVNSLTGAIDACGRGGRWQAALLLLKQMAAGRLRPNIFTVSAVTSALARAGEWQRALGHLGDSEACRLDPDRIAFNMLVGACGKAQRWGAALDTLEVMGARRLEIGIVDYSAVIHACSKVVTSLRRFVWPPGWPRAKSRASRAPPRRRRSRVPSSASRALDPDLTMCQ